MSQEQPNPTSQESPPVARKRRRVPLACNGCRNRKSRCDGQRPQCSTCVDFEQACVYQSTEPWNRNTGAREAKKLENRLKVLENRLLFISDCKTENDSSSVNLDDRLSKKSLPNRQEYLQEPLCFGLEDSDMLSSQPKPPKDLLANAETEHVQRADTSQHSVDGMGTIMRNGTTETSSFYGPTSNIALIDQIEHKLSQLGSRGPGPNIIAKSQVLNEAPDIPLDAFSAASTIEIDSSALPPENEATSLVNNYFRSAGLIVPCLHEESFLDAYNRIWHCDRRGVSRIWMATLNLVFAISSSGAIPHSELPDTRNRVRGFDFENNGAMNAKSEIYFQRALALGDSHLVKNTGLGLVQFLVLLATWLQGNQRSLQTWPVHALTVAAALESGLHSSDTMAGLPAIEQEIRRRVWYCVLINDRFMSVWFGRPSLISLPSIQDSLPRDLNFMHPSRLISSTIASMAISEFRAEINLSEIISDLVSQLYNRNTNGPQAIPAEEIACRHSKICWDLAKWQDHLTEPLKLITFLELSKAYVSKTAEANRDGFLVLRFRVYLTLRYLNVRLLLHRSILTSFMKLNKSEDMPNNRACSRTFKVLLEYGSTMFHDCLLCCREMISLVGEIIAASAREAIICGAWWLSAYYTFNAALVTFSLLLVDRDHALGLNRDSMQTTLDNAINVMRKMEEGHSTIRSCRMYTSHLREAWQSLGATNNTLPGSAFYVDSSTAAQGIQWLPEAQTFSWFNLQNNKTGSTQSNGNQLFESEFDLNLEGF